MNWMATMSEASIMGAADVGYRWRIDEDAADEQHTDTGRAACAGPGLIGDDGENR